jgi:hypothetical protein
MTMFWLIFVDTPQPLLLSLNQFLSDYATDGQCEAVFEEIRCPQGFQFPK